MTLKRRLFISNILMIFLPFALSWLVMIGIVWFGMRGMGFDMSPAEKGQIKKQIIADWYQAGRGKGNFIVMMTFQIFITVAVNKFLTFLIIKHIMKPLDALASGVRYIGENNLAYRLTYHEDDEFRRVCDIFNETAARLERMVQEQEKNERARRELIAGISHDLRTPLTSIKVSIEGIKSGVATTIEQQKKYFRFIENKTADMEYIIEQLFLFSKLDMDEYRVETRLVNCGEMLEDCIEELHDEYEQRGLVITAGVLPDDTYISIDPLLFRRVIINIVENAVKYKTAETGHLAIEYVRSKNVTIILADDGPGVASESLEKLFTVFYRTDQSRHNKGSGLGLAVSAKIISKMGGGIHAELPAVGGLAIVINFPLADKPSLITEKETSHD